MPRLNDFSYKGRYRYFVTLRCFLHTYHFSNYETTTYALEILKETAERQSFHVWAYCFMPDHAHLLIEGKLEDSDMGKFISAFKQRTSFWFRSRFKAKLWQPGYYDRILRADESTSRVIRYILDNPVRKKIVSDYSKYRNSGSLELTDISQLFE